MTTPFIYCAHNRNHGRDSLYVALVDALTAPADMSTLTKVEEDVTCLDQDYFTGINGSTWLTDNAEEVYIALG